jgi:hypothetical protein
MTDFTSRLDTSISAMADHYPRFALQTEKSLGGRIAAWTGDVQPIQSDELLAELLDDLAHDRPVYIPEGGRVIHHPYCLVGKHGPLPWLHKVKDPYVTYTLRVRYGGGEQHPRAYVLAPRLLPYKNGQFHLRHNLEDGAICAYLPSDDVWSWQHNTVVDFMSHVLLWLIKWTIWDQAGIWIGREMPHTANFLVQYVKPTMQCRCSSGKEYGKCHREQDLLAASTNPARL